LIAEDYVLHARTRAALAAARTRCIDVVIVTGRMFQAVRPYLTGPEPVVCYQGAAVVDPTTGVFLSHVSIPLPLAREAIDAIERAGFGLNCYVDDELYVAKVTPEAERYASFQHIQLHVVGSLLDWLEREPTKLVVVGDPDALDVLGAQLREHFRNRLFIAKSLPYFLEFANPEVSKGSGLAYVAERIGFTSGDTVAFGDGENDRELLDWAGYGVAVANAHEEILARADFVCPSAQDQGVAQVIEALLASPVGDAP
jgi:Cof subfamily protein (haloacid dehalogenase superfamily)